MFINIGSYIDSNTQQARIEQMAPTTKKNSKRAASPKDTKPAKKARISVDSSEDELDNVSSSDDDLDEIVSSDDEDNEETEEITTEDGIKGEGSDNHTEQRKLLKERKLQRRSGSEIQQIKNVWEKLRVKNPPIPKAIREKLCNEIWELSKEHFSDLILKHDASRIVQTLIKYSSKERREEIVNALKGKYYVLATSSYGKYLLVKLLHYGTKNSRQVIIDELHGNLRKLMRHKEGAYVVEDLYVLYATNEQRRQMIREFWGSEYAVFRNDHKDLTIEEVCSSSVEKRSIISKNLLGTINASVEKGSTGFQILHAAMKELVKVADASQISEMIEILHEQFAELVHTPEGADVACTLISMASAKERKLILRSLKDHADKLITNEHGNMVFINILMVVDDTVLVYKTFGGAVKEAFVDFVTDKYGRRPLIYMFMGLNGKYFSPNIKKDLERYVEMSSKTSKKDPVVRKQELLSKFTNLYLNAVGKGYATIIPNNFGSQFLSELLTSDDFYAQLDEANIVKYEEILKSVTVYFKGDVTESKHPIHEVFSTRFLKSLISKGRWNNKEKKLVPFEHIKELGVPFATKFYDEIIDSTNLLVWINEKDSSFTIVALYETLNGAKEGKQFLKDLKAIKKEIDADDSNKGAQLLLKLMK